MRYVFLICLSILLIYSCKSDKQEDTKVETPISKTLSDSQKELQHDAQTVAIDENTAKQPLQEDKPAVAPKPIIKKEAPKKTSSKSNVAKKKNTKKVITSKKKDEPKPMAIIKFDEKELNFKEITEGDIIEHDFYFTNTGNAPLEILEADATCGCATPEIPFLSIEPGKRNKIHVRYNSVNKEGYETPSITIKTNGAPTYVKLELYGTVKPRKYKKPMKLENPAADTGK